MEESRLCFGILSLDARFAWVGAVGVLQVSRARNTSHLLSNSIRSVLCGLCSDKTYTNHIDKDGEGQEMAAADREGLNGSTFDEDEDDDDEGFNNGDVEAADLKELSKYTEIKQRPKYNRVHDLDTNGGDANPGPPRVPRVRTAFSRSEPTRKNIFVIGPHWYCVFVALGTIVGGAFLTNSILSNMDYSSNTTLALRGFVNLCCTSAVVFLFLTATTNAGIVNIERRIMKPVAVPDWSASRDGSSRSGWCEICQQPSYRDDPERTYHCGDCNVCIVGHDHHCPWMGQCIGEGNMRWFILFNISWVLAFVELITLAFLM